jgi:hypothetical protein
VYIVEALTSVGVPLMVQVALSILKPVGRVGATVQLAIVYQTTDATFAQAGNSDPSQFSAYSPAATSTDTTATSITMTLSGTDTVNACGNCS